MVVINRLDPVRAGEPETDAAIVALHALDVASNPRPDAPAPSLRAFTDSLVAPSFGRYREIWVGRTDDRIVGGYAASFPTMDNTHLVVVFMLSVDPAYRRRGIGREFTDHLHARAVEAGRRTVFGFAGEGSPSVAFAKAVGYSNVATDRQSSLELAEVDNAALRALRTDAEQRAAGYRLERIAGPVPDHLLDDMVRLRMGMNDAPVEDLEYGDEKWDVERCRKAERRFRDGIWRSYLTLARHEATGEVAGWTRIEVDTEAVDDWAYQEDTGVLADHRGHRLGLLLKLANLEWVREAEPRVGRIITWNNSSNRHMLAINDAMGFHPYQTWLNVQHRVA